MLTIGFTTKFYTLWDVTVESVINEYGRKGERGYCAYYEGEFMKADEVAKLEREDAAFADLVAAIDRVGFVIVESATNIRREDDERGKHYVSYTKNNVTIEWPENMIERFSYNGYEYYLPVKGGKAKRIKGKNLKVITDSYRIEGRCMAIVDAEYFEILK